MDEKQKAATVELMSATDSSMLKTASTEVSRAELQARHDEAVAQLKLKADELKRVRQMKDAEVHSFFSSCPLEPDCGRLAPHVFVFTHVLVICL